MKFMQDTEILADNNELLEDVKVKGRVYELGLLLVPSIAQDNLLNIFNKIRDVAISFGGHIIMDEIPKLIPLAYTMDKVISNVRHKFDNAYFGWIKFTISATEVLELKKVLDLDNDIIRFLILKTVKENTVASKRFIRMENAPLRFSQVKRNPEVSVPINKEEIDKEIDAMVSV